MDGYVNSAEALRSALQKEYAQLLTSNHVLAETMLMKKLRAIQAGWILLAAVQELHFFYGNNHCNVSTRMTKILLSAQQSLCNPCQSTIADLSNQVTLLRQFIEQSKKEYRFFAKIDLLGGLTSTACSMMGMAYGIAILLGFSGLALGPFGAIALGAGVLFVSAILASAGLDDIALNGRFCQNSQLAEIEAYVNTLETEFLSSAQQPSVQPVAEEKPNLFYPSINAS